MKIPLLYTLFLLFLCTCCRAVDISREDREVLGRFWKYAQEKGLESLTVRERIPLIGQFFLGTPYREKTLENPEREELVINLRGLDCVTFVENVLALAFLPQYGEESTDSLAANLRKIRYRDGLIRGWSSRLHYSSDWFYGMQEKGLLQDMGQEAGGEEFHPNTSFISTHPQLYPYLARHPEETEDIRKAELANNRRRFHYIPKDRIAGTEHLIRPGDIILITTVIRGLDTSHLGIAVSVDGRIHLMHASSTGKKVMVTSRPLCRYMQDIRSQTGILLGRAPAAIP